MSHINAINDSAQFAESVHKIKQSVIIQKAAGCFGQLLGGVFIAAGIALIANGASEYSFDYQSNRHCAKT